VPHRGVIKAKTISSNGETQTVEQRSSKAPDKKNAASIVEAAFRFTARDTDAISVFGPRLASPPSLTGERSRCHNRLPFSRLTQYVRVLRWNTAAGRFHFLQR
jgi:hypothetical protein